MKTALTTISNDELLWRYTRVRALLREICPEAGGLLTASRISIYYLTGTLATGLLWLPLDGEPVLLVRKALGRAQLESPLKHQKMFRSYKEITSLCQELGSPLTAQIGVEMDSFTWTMSELLTQRLPDSQFLPADRVLMRAMAVKSPLELSIMRLGGELHRQCVVEQIPACVHIGMSEYDIAVKMWELFYAKGHCGITRMRKPFEELHLGFVCVGESSLYPHTWDGPLGGRGVHPAAPMMGDPNTIWEKHNLLVIDVGFALEGYNTDITKVYWSGSAASIPESVYRAQQVCMAIYNEAIDGLRVGALPSALWEKAHAHAKREGYADAFQGLPENKVEFLGHGIGLFVDMYPAFAKGFDVPLEAGMTVAIEPKIAVPGYGMVGVENTLLITESSAESLTGNAIEIICID